jgi:hypothetical protein
MALAEEETLLKYLRYEWGTGSRWKRDGFTYEQEGSAMSAVFVRG